MTTSLIQRNILTNWLIWQFWETPGKIVQAWKNILKFNLEFFSVSLLLKTLFSYWHQYRWYYPKGFDIGKYLEVFFSNMISRILGAIVRIIFIILGLITEVFIFFAGLIIIFFWIISPGLAIFCLWHGLRLLY